LIRPAATAGGESASKKAKQQQAAKPASSGPRPLAVVGDKQLAATRPAIVRELYAESAELSAMPQSEVQKLMEERRTAVDGSSLRPVMSFEQTGLPADMLHAVRDFVQPSPIQSQVRVESACFDSSRCNLMQAAVSRTAVGSLSPAHQLQQQLPQHWRQTERC
jgi:hypothetical protein